MARAAYIYIVVTPDYDGDHIEAAFTVKHECISWLNRNPSESSRSIVRQPDGESWGRTPARFTEEEFIP